MHINHWSYLILNSKCWRWGAELMCGLLVSNCISTGISSVNLHNVRTFIYSGCMDAFTRTSAVSLISESDFLLRVTCSGFSADSVTLYLALGSARLLRLDREATEVLIQSISSSDKLRLTYSYGHPMAHVVNNWRYVIHSHIHSFMFYFTFRAVTYWINYNDHHLCTCSNALFLILWLAILDCEVL